MSKINILLADDHKIIRDGIKLMLGNVNGYKIVAEQSNGKEVIEYLNEFHDKIDVVLLDISMPVMDGIEATKYITQHFKDIKVLALTMHSEETYITNMVKAGAYGYILKESGADELTRAIDSVYKGKKYYSNDVSVTMINSMINEDRKMNSELSDREREILKHIGLGLTNNQIGENLSISGRTVETHRRNIMGKLELNNTAEMIRYAIEKGIIES